jgi:hypothetical protein
MMVGDVLHMTSEKKKTRHVWRSGKAFFYHCGGRALGCMAHVKRLPSIRFFLQTLSPELLMLPSSPARLCWQRKENKILSKVTFFIDVNPEWSNKWAGWGLHSLSVGLSVSLTLPSAKTKQYRQDRQDSQSKSRSAFREIAKCDKWSCIHVRTIEPHILYSLLLDDANMSFAQIRPMFRACHVLQSLVC